MAIRALFTNLFADFELAEKPNQRIARRERKKRGEDGDSERVIQETSFGPESIVACLTLSLAPDRARCRPGGNRVNNFVELHAVGAFDEDEVTGLQPPPQMLRHDRVTIEGVY